MCDTTRHDQPERLSRRDAKPDTRPRLARKMTSAWSASSVSFYPDRASPPFHLWTAATYA